MARRRPVEVEEVDEDERISLDSAEEEALDDDDIVREKPKDDAYTGLLVISLLSLILACVFWYLDHSSLSTQQISPPAVNISGLSPNAPSGQ